ncbi:MAG: alpha/beta fold hydrolase [Bacteroidetes bacterium]|nr:alpha/beta fold hydrolase [Bacteroidota bacterium]MCA6444464.1 alpha/beta fold hydrolase [Bacteroidota bacterium]
MKNIILLHGAIGSQEQLNPLASELKHFGFKVFSFNFSGHGMAPFQKAFGIPQFAQELLVFINQNKLQMVDVFGYSMGGYVALYLSSLQPNLIGRIVTLGTKFAWDPVTAEKEIKQLQPEQIKVKVPKFAVALEKRHGEKWELLLNQTAQLMIALGEFNLLNKKSLENIKSKVFLGMAEHDSMVTDDETQGVAETIVNAERYFIKAAEHPIETVDSGLLAKQINQFLY